jgi:hypothetical protein
MSTWMREYAFDSWIKQYQVSKYYRKVESTYVREMNFLVSPILRSLSRDIPRPGRVGCPCPRARGSVWPGVSTRSGRSMSTLAMKSSGPILTLLWTCNDR